MNNEDFLKEVHQYIDENYRQFETYQAVAREILIELDRVCQLNGIRYWLAFGNMIGAVRDGGQAPWDYDIDVLSPIDDRDLLFKALKEDLGKDFYYCYSDNTPHYPAKGLRVCKKGYSMMALHVDVFFLFGCPSDDREKDKQVEEVKQLISIRKRKFLPYHIKANSKQSRMVAKAKQLRYAYLSEDALKKKEEELLHRHPMSTADTWMPYGGKKVCYFPKEVFGTVMMPYGDREFPVPSGYDLFLTKVYGDYKKYPSIRSRFDEFLKMKRVIDQRLKNQ